MRKKEPSTKGFPLLTAAGVLFVILLCLLTSAMIYLSIPETAPFIELLIQNSSQAVQAQSAIFQVDPSPTPFLPVEQHPLETSATPKPTETPSPTATTFSQPTPETKNGAAEEIGNLPPSASITGIYGSPQLYTLDCEAQAAVDWARFYGVPIDELEFIDRLPQSDDPEEGFVGYVNGPMGQLPPDDYGVHAGPVADLLVQYDLPAKAVRGWDLKKIKNEIAEGRPVIVWIVNLPFDIETQEYTASNGNTSTVARFEHTWIVTAYNAYTFTVIDSEWTYNVKTETFLERWNALGNQAIVYQGD